jgi:DNA-binding GntR family transcriptional regulator
VDHVEPLVRSDSFTERTLHAVRELILDGHFGPGDRVNEAELANSLGVSRGPLREALQQLSSEGLVHRIQHRGTFIPTFGADETVQLSQLREALEVMATRLAAERVSPTDLTDLRAVLETTSERLSSRADAHYPADLDFHARVMRVAGNPMLAQRASEVHRQLHVARARSAYKPERARQAYDEHLEILRALEAHDPDWADQAMRAHLRSAFAHVRQLFGLNDH